MVDVRLHIPAIRELRTSSRADRMILARAERVAALLGPGFEAELSPGKNRARATVFPVTIEAARKVAENPARMIAALEAGR
jgi:hypothetical protein